MATCRPCAELSANPLGVPHLSVSTERRTPDTRQRAVHETTTWTVGLCNGVALLALVGVLKGQDRGRGLEQAAAHVTVAAT
jgi:phosphoribosylformylglycinamidine (FGAM) synthase-like amidotransferase family enzyme